MSDTVMITVDGHSLQAERGRPLGAVLHQAIGPALRRDGRSGAARGLFCGMGVCFDCLVTVNGRQGVRACVTPVVEGMRIETGLAGESR